MKHYEAKKHLTDKELSALIKLTNHILKEAKKRGVEMSNRTARKHALEYLGWASVDRIEPVETSRSFIEGLRSANVKYKKPK